MTIDPRKVLQRRRTLAERSVTDEATLPPWITGQAPQDLSRVLWRVIDPERADKLASVSPDEAERVRRVDILCDHDRSLNIEDMLQMTLDDLRALDADRPVIQRKRQRLALRTRENARKGRRAYRLPDDGLVIADDWRLTSEGQLERRERWVSWQADEQIETEVWAPKRAAWTEWRGKSIRTDTIVHALLNPHLQLPGGVVRGRRLTPKTR